MATKKLTEAEQAEQAFIAGMGAATSSALRDQAVKVGARIDALEQVALDLPAEYRRLGLLADRDYVLTVQEAGNTPVIARTWPDVKSVLFGNGATTWAGKSDASVRRAWIIGRAMPEASDLVAWQDAKVAVRAAVPAKPAKDADAATKAEYKRLAAIADSPAYGDGVSAVATYATAVLAKRVNTTTGEVTPAPNASKVAPSADATNAADALVALLTGKSEDPSGEWETTVVPGITVGRLAMLTVEQRADLVTVLVAASKVGKSKLVKVEVPEIVPAPAPAPAPIVPAPAPAITAEQRDQMLAMLASMVPAPVG